MLRIADAYSFEIRPREARFNAVGSLNVSFGNPGGFGGHREQNQLGSVLLPRSNLLMEQYT